MASKWFEGLSEKAQGFLIATLLFKSKDCESVFERLDIQDANLMRARAHSILRLNRDQRVKLLVAQLKLLLLSSSRSWILAVDSSWLVELLKNESKEMQALALASLPKPLTKPVGLGLSFSKEELEKLVQVSPALSKVIRKSIEKQLTPMRAVDFDTKLRPSHLLLLTRIELEVLINEASSRGILGEDDGLKALARLFVNEPKAIQEEVAQRLDFTTGQGMLQYIKDGNFSDETQDVQAKWYALIAELAKNRKIDERFARCAERK